MRGHTPFEGELAVPAFLSECLRRHRIETIQISALVEAGESSPPVNDDVGAGRVLHPGARTLAALGATEFGRLGESGPQGAAGILLGRQPVSPYESIAVERLSVTKAHDVNHSVAVEGMISLHRGMERILGVAQVDTVEVFRNLTEYDFEVVRFELGGLGLPRAGAIRVIVIGGKRGQQLAYDFDVHGILFSTDGERLGCTFRKLRRRQN